MGRIGKTLANLLLHAVATFDCGPTARPGVRGEQLAPIEGPGFVAWATCMPAGAAPLGKADLLDHHAIVTELAAQAGGVLPARFPTWVDDESALRGQLDRRRGSLIEALARVRGRAEMAI